jgi:hypothetical protein
MNLERLIPEIALVAVGVVAAYIAGLVDRVKRLEKQAEQTSKEFVEVVNRLAARYFHPSVSELKDIKAHDTGTALDRIENYIFRSLFKYTPALRRVVSFSILVSVDFLREKTGVTLDDLKGLEQQFGDPEPKELWVAKSTVMEEWATHTVVTDFAGRREVIYPSYNFGHYMIDPKVIWSHSLPGTEMFNYSTGGNLEIVLFQGSIFFWAKGGHFGSGMEKGGAKAEYYLVHVPLDEGMLKEFRSRMDTPNENPEIRFLQVPWIRHYDYEEPDGKFCWTLRVTDVVGYVAEK